MIRQSESRGHGQSAAKTLSDPGDQSEVLETAGEARIGADEEGAKAVQRYELEISFRSGGRQLDSLKKYHVPVRMEARTENGQTIVSQRPSPTEAWRRAVTGTAVPDKRLRGAISPSAGAKVDDSVSTFSVSLGLGIWPPPVNISLTVACCQLSSTRDRATESARTSTFQPFLRRRRSSLSLSASVAAAVIADSWSRAACWSGVMVARGGRWTDVGSASDV